MPRYNPAIIEPKWQKFWMENRTFACPSLPKGRKLYVLDMFPYPSGDGLHVGHPEGYTATDIVCRYNRMKGVSVMHPMGWDAFGLPAELHAKKTGTPPRETTEKNIATFRRQLQMLGFSYDWDRELATTDVNYFRWTQWIFLVLYDTWFDQSEQRGRPIAELPIPEEVESEGEAAVERYRDEHRLAYQIEAPVNWCPALGTVLANEEVVGGVSERGGHPVVRAKLRQWMLRITAYADRLEKDLDGLDWSEGIKLLQRNWIGRSTGAEVDFFIGARDSGLGTRENEEAALRTPNPESRTPNPEPRTPNPESRTPNPEPRIPNPESRTPNPEYDAWKQHRTKTGFPRKPGNDVLRIYTTRADTLFGATYMVIAPEHPFVERLTVPEQREAVHAYCQQAARKSDLDRTDLAKEKTGVWTGSYAVNPVNGESIPIWVADYVLISYGTGAIMAVPAHDTRDFEFAKQFDLPIIAVVDPGKEGAGASGQGSDTSNHKSQIPNQQIPNPQSPIPHPSSAFIADGVAINSGPYNELPTAEFKRKIAEDLDSQGIGRAAVNYKLRDWLFSRQHFWGEPFPLLHELDDDGQPTGRIRALEPSELPLDLPVDMAFDADHDQPEPPLDKAPEDWLYVTIDGRRYKRETNTMPQWAGSCWYYLRFLDPKNDRALVDPQIEKAWMPVDLYVGGAEHAVLHLLYARFWHKVLFDRGHVGGDEPFQKLVNQGMILGEMEHTAYKWPNGDYYEGSEWTSDIEISPEGTIYVCGDKRTTSEKVSSEEIEKVENCFVWIRHPKAKIDSRSYKMSKSRGNVVNPDEVVREYGADSLRLFEMFMGPLEAVKPWSMDGVSGVRGFLDRAWRMIVDERAEAMQLNPAVQDIEPTAEQNRMLHKTIKAVTTDLDQMSFNTAISRMMEFTNFFLKQESRPRAAMEKLVLLLSPFAPHAAEELWALLGHDESLASPLWPEFDEAAIKEDTIEVPVQINGKLRGRIQVPAEADKAALEAAARAEPKVAELLAGKTVVKAIIVPGRMVNFVVK